MPDDRESSSGIGVVIAAVAVVLVLLMCGGGALVVAGLVFYTRASAVPISAPPPPAVAVPEAAHVDVIAIEADGSLLWNDAPLTSSELRQRLDGLKNAGGPPRSVVLKADAAAPAASRDEVVQLLTDRGIGYIVEQAK